ncbi:MAG: winged helix-turn-helix transcriptional regulator, partial [Acidimicrobiales bacterium]
MKTYGQYCGLAKALDRVGDRWSLLIVRELLLGPARFSDLRDALPGIATNLLTERLRALEGDGIVRRAPLGRPVRAVVYELTEVGHGLDDAVSALVRWGGRWMTAGPAPGEAFQPRWLVVALRSLLAGDAPPAVSGEVTVSAAGEAITVAATGGRRSVELGAAESPGAVVEADPPTVLGIASGVLTLAAARRSRGARV